MSKLAESLAQLATCKERIAEMEAKLEERSRWSTRLRAGAKRISSRILEKSLMKETKWQESMAKKAVEKKKDMAGLRARIEDLEMEIAVA